ncbi:MAG: hypothetical protein NZ602_11540 [Thermoguttaceae bacterium]|nr:hypothetical protein [Thermoguttaceae bacterium]MDW8039527.1 uroporphyrinogen decarboxylase family protein [Thermoguttaceae bacterium]
MSSRRELVQQAIRFQRPERIPIWFVNADQEQGDVMVYHLLLGQQGVDDPQVKEWGYRLEYLDDGTMGHPTKPLLPDWQVAETYQPPPLREEERMAGLPEFLAACEDRYRLASLDLSGFTTYMFLRGFENAMVDFVWEPERFSRLMNLIWDFECRLIELAAQYGFDAIHFVDDWGTQKGLMISPALWRKLFAPGYRRQFELAHRLGLDVWFHCCGNITEIVEDFHHLGVDVMNISQPNVVDIEAVGNRLRGKQCFLMPISYQTVGIHGTRDEIFAEAERLYRALGTPDGGFIGYVEEYSCMGMSAENYWACAEAFRRLKPAP